MIGTMCADSFRPLFVMPPSPPSWKIEENPYCDMSRETFLLLKSLQLTCSSNKCSRRIVPICCSYANCIFKNPCLSVLLWVGVSSVDNKQRPFVSSADKANGEPFVFGVATCISSHIRPASLCRIYYMQ